MYCTSMSMDVLYFLVLPFLAKIIGLDTTVLGIDTISVVNKSGTMDIFQT